jgi:nucleoside-diphosphate-sugar epimerase
VNPLRIALTGATGFIGRHVARTLSEAGHEVHALARRSSNTSGLLKAAGISVEVSDISAAALAATLGRFSPDVVVHLAAVAAPDDSAEGVDAMIAANLGFGTALLHAARASGCSAVVNTGTYWQFRGPAASDAVSLYAATKQAYQDILEYHASAHGARALTLVLYDTYGPADPRGKLVSLFATAASTGVPLVASPGDQLIDLLHVEDAAAAFAVAVERVVTCEAGHFERRAVRSGAVISPRDLAGMVQRVLGREVPVQWGGRPHRPREIMTPPALPILEAWQPAIGLEEGLRQVLLGEPLKGPTPSA